MVSNEGLKNGEQHGRERDSPRETAVPPRSNVRAPLAMMEQNRRLGSSEHMRLRHTIRGDAASLSHALRSRETPSSPARSPKQSRSRTCGQRLRGVFRRTIQERARPGVEKEACATGTMEGTSRSERGDE